MRGNAVNAAVRKKCKCPAYANNGILQQFIADVVPGKQRCYIAVHSNKAAAYRNHFACRKREPGKADNHPCNIGKHGFCSGDMALIASAILPIAAAACLIEGASTLPKFIASASRLPFISSTLPLKVFLHYLVLTRR